jgi:hypothetical protein
MSDLRTAAQQALEALEFMADEWGFTQKANRPERWQAIDALRAALAEEALQRLTDVHQEIEAVLEQPEQEPVATVAMDVSRAHISWDGKYLGQRPDMKIAMLLKDLPVGTLLFTHPPRREWRGLTEEEFWPMLEAEGRADRKPVEIIAALARAVEAALRERNA